MFLDNIQENKILKKKNENNIQKKKKEKFNASYFFGHFLEDVNIYQGFLSQM